MPYRSPCGVWVKKFICAPGLICELSAAILPTSIANCYSWPICALPPVLGLHHSHDQQSISCRRTYIQVSDLHLLAPIV
jgi:hypothetical protein